MATKSGINKAARVYDVNEYKQKIELALAKLREQKAGEASGKASKNDILSMYKKEIAKLVKDGYTAQQIAAAIKTDAFGILPKSITQLLDDDTKKATTRTKKVAVSAANKTPSAQKQDTTKAVKPPASATFKINPDEAV